jgi:hypothetical protein
MLSRVGVEAQAEPWWVPPVLYIPAREVVTFYPTMLGLNHRYELSLDKAAMDLVAALVGPRLRHPTSRRLLNLCEEIDKSIGGQLEVRPDGIFQLNPKGDIEASMMAEGHRKLGILSLLIRNGNLGRGTILLWDEPEGNVNPVLMRTLVWALNGLAREGVQIVLATHDHLFTQLLSIPAEYGKNEVPVRFFSLYRDGGADAPVQVEAADDLIHLSGDILSREHGALFDLEHGYVMERVGK